MANREAFGQDDFFRLHLNTLYFLAAVDLYGYVQRAAEAERIPVHERRSLMRVAERKVGFRLFDRGIHYRGDHPWTPTVEGAAWCRIVGALVQESKRLEAVARGLAGSSGYDHQRKLMLRTILLSVFLLPETPHEHGQRGAICGKVNDWLGLTLWKQGGRSRVFGAVYPYLNEFGEHVIQLYNLTIALRLSCKSTP